MPTLADAYEDRIAAAIVSELNADARPWKFIFDQEQCVATRTRAPWYEPPELETLKVAVVPLTIDRDRESLGARDRRNLDYGIGIDLQRTVTPTDDAMLKSLSSVAEAIHDFFDDGHQLTGLTGWFCRRADREDVYSLTHLYAEKLWETLIVASVRGWRR